MRLSQCLVVLQHVLVPRPLPLTLVCWLPWECPTHWPPFVLVAEMMEAVCVGMCGCGCGRNKNNVLATLMNTVDHMTSHVQYEKSQGCHVTITEALSEEMHKQRHSPTTGTPLVTAR